MKKQTLVFGAGAIGKAVAGYSFAMADCGVIFTDVNEDVIADLNRRKSYRIYTGPDKYDIVMIAGAALTCDEEKVLRYIAAADYVCVSVGKAHVDSVLDMLAKGIRLRAANPEANRLRILFFENIEDILGIALRKLNLELNAYELAHVDIIETSIERMSRSMSAAQNDRDVIAEKFIPVILDKKQAGGD